MPELTRNRWTWNKPSSTAYRQWYQAEAIMAEGIWQGRSFLYGRAVTYDRPSRSDGLEYRAGTIGWHPDHPIVLTDGHDGDVIGAAVWAEDAPDGLYAVWEIRPDRMVEAIAAGMNVSAELSVRTRSSAGSLSDTHALDHVALVRSGAVPGAQVHAVATPWDVYVRQGDAGMVHAGIGPAAFAPTPSVADLMGGQLVATRAASTVSLPLNRLELRKASGGRRARLVGVAVPYDSRTHKAGGSPELFRLGAFAHDAQHPERVRLYQNNHDQKGRPAGVAVELTERRDGLHAVFELYDTQTGRQALEEVREGVYGGLSVGFVATRERHTGGVREVLGARLHHVSLVDEPAYDGATIYGVTPADIAPRVTPKVDRLVPA